ncbi:hypothetical protein HNY73_016110 [Argiope bruennichi]|uniref:Transposase Tc1-like domain-containing protein n=1 Tax=Argiope bruennichi TaxID=94029 RepID=A0A8T0EL63_ARGBR|nr:hypothetical protein HNY73_016110 [Argiope bruennichi]
MSKSKELSEFDCGNIVGCHLCEIADILQKLKSTVNDVIVKWKRRGSETSGKRTGRQKKLAERSRRTLKRVAKQNCKSSLVEISQEFQSSSDVSVSSRTVRRGLKTLGCTTMESQHHSSECEASNAMVYFYKKFELDLPNDLVYKDSTETHFLLYY